MYVCVGFMALITAIVLCVRSQDSLLSVSVRRVHVVFSTVRFKAGRKSTKLEDMNEIPFYVQQLRRSCGVVVYGHSLVYPRS